MRDFFFLPSFCYTRDHNWGLCHTEPQADFIKSKWHSWFESFNLWTILPLETIYSVFHLTNQILSNSIQSLCSLPTLNLCNLVLYIQLKSKNLIQPKGFLGLIKIFHFKFQNKWFPFLDSLQSVKMC